ncbi:MAG: cobalamin-dependent protein, partial [Oligoflexia bacterium]|nr:cobalamin-dependent protein [Oligoflexia bacterium]
DCMAEKIGWTSLRQRIIDENPQVVCVSESHALYINETLKLISLVHSLCPEAYIIAGGGHFANMAQTILLQKHPIDFIVIGEGEITLGELLPTLKKRDTKKDLKMDQGDFSNIDGLAYLQGEKVTFTNPRSLIEDLDTLPMPAYDLMPMDRYGQSKYLFSPGGITIEHSRGCVYSCHFCVWWTQMAERKKLDTEQVEVRPRWRTKSIEKVLEEINYLQHEFNKHCFIFVDATWNIDSNWNLKFSEEIIKRKIRINWFGFMRADYLLRDEKSGTLNKMVSAGLSHICIGLEHLPQFIQHNYGKKFLQENAGIEVVKLFRKKYPTVFLQTTFIVGHEDESRETIVDLKKYVKKVRPDFPAFHFLTPVPGTKVYSEAVANNKLEETNFERYDWNTPIMKTKYLSREELQYEVYLLYKNSVGPIWLLRGLFSRSTYKRNMYIWWIIVTFKVIGTTFKERLLKNTSSTNVKNDVFNLITPNWYKK